MDYVRNQNPKDELAEKIFFQHLFNEQGNLQKTFLSSQKDILSQIEVVKSMLNHINKNVELKHPLKRKEISIIRNITGFILLISLDLKGYMKILISCTEMEDRILLMKNIAILIYEAIDDIGNMIAKEYFESCEILGVTIDLVDYLKMEKKKLSAYKTKYGASLKKVRVNIGAHRIQDFLTQVECGDSIDFIRFLPVMYEFDKLLNELSAPLRTIMTVTSTLFGDR